MDLLDSLPENLNSKKDAKPKRMSLTGGRPGRSSTLSAPSSSTAGPVPGRSDGGTNKRPNENEAGPSSKRTSMFGQTPPTGEFCIPEHINVQLNMFEVILENCKPVFERIHMDIYLITARGKEVQMNGESLHGDVNESYRRWALWNIYKCIVRLRPDLFDAKMTSHHFGAYDCASALYMPFGTYKGGEEELVEFVEGNADKKIWAPIAKSSRAAIGKIKVKLVRNKEKRSCGKIYMTGEKLMDIGNRSEAIRCLEVITSQETHTRDYYQFGNATFNRSSDMIIIRGQEQIDRQCQIESEGKEIKTGFDKSIRMIIDGDNTPKMLMTIDVRRSPFYKHMPVLEWLMLVYGKTSRKQNERNNSGSNRPDDSIDSRAIDDIVRVMKNEGPSTTNRKLDELRAVGVSPTNLDNAKNNVMYIQKFDYTSAKENIFPMKNKNDDTVREISIYEYFLEKYNIRLNYPKLPIAVMKGTKCNVKIPLELLRIERGQRVKQNNISPAVQQEMTGKLSMLPNQHVEKYTTILNDYLKVDRSQHLRAFGIKINKNPFSMQAKILPAPVLTFGNSRQNLLVTGMGKRLNIFIKPCRLISPATVKSIILVNFNDVMQEHEMRRLGGNLEKACVDHGIRFEQPSRNWKIVSVPEAMHDELDELLKNAKKDNISIVLGVTKDKRPEVHDVLKLYEAKYGQQTAHLSLQSVRQIMDAPGGQTIDNVVRKFNLKCGGSNFGLSIPKMLHNKMVCTNEKEMQKKLFENTMFVGFELSHAGATCEFDQLFNITCGEPSVVGVSYSFAKPFELGGFSYLQTPREHSLQNLPKYFPTAVVSYSKTVRSLPRTIIIYRSGMGEGDLKNIETDEVDQMRKSLRENEEILRINHGKPYEPKFVVIVVLKKSHIRIFPKHIEGQKSFQQNVPSGTCIDYKLTGCHGYDEFLLVSQSAMIGTVRPTKYAVLVNDRKWPKSDIVHLTYFLAFGHQVSTNPPGVPSVLYAAENLAKRGRNNFKIHQRLIKYNNVESYSKAPLEENAPDSAKIDQLSDSLNLLSLKQKMFWA